MQAERVTVLNNDSEQRDGVTPILLKLTKEDIEELKEAIDDTYIPIGAYDIVMNMIKSFILIAEVYKPVSVKIKE